LIYTTSTPCPSDRCQSRTNRPEFRSTFEFSIFQKYRKVTNIYESFVKLTSMGDVTAVYRRPIWAHLSAAELIAPASDVFLCIPASRNAVLGYIGMLIHENAHQCFSKQENPQYGPVHFFLLDGSRMFPSFLGVDYTSVENAAVWCCTISSELSQHNAGRLSVVNLPRGPESLLELFKMVGSIAQLIKLIDTTINVLLAKCPDECMTVLFDASRHVLLCAYSQKTITFPGSIVDHLFTVGADQFKAYVEDIRIKERNQVSPAILSSIHEDYNVKFNSLSDVFNFLTRRQIQDSLDNGVFDNLNFVFFFKLVTCSVDTLRFLITHFFKATPANFFRGIRQLMSVDHRLVLSNIPYLDFAKQMIRALDVNSLAVLLNLIVRAAHSKPNLSVIEYPAIAEFASGKKLHPSWYVISQMVKASEIVCRFIQTSFLSDISTSLKGQICVMHRLSVSLFVSHVLVLGKSSILRVLNNLRVIFEWESTTDASMLNMKHFG
uniref:INTS5_N domain-containing protein n=1 Tax=Haemonchus placei TaxID=6290 RepID=A0A0N4W157_HAEPC